MPTAVTPRIDAQAIPLLALPSLSFHARKALPRCAAIYFVLNASGTVLYIGKSINLAVRWAAHHRAVKLTENKATRIAWMVINDLSLLGEIEEACIAYFDPICNGTHGRGGGGRPATEAATYTVITVRLPPTMLAVLRDHQFRARGPAV